MVSAWARPSFDKLRMTCDKLRMTCDKLRMTCDKLRVTCDELRMTCVGHRRKARVARYSPGGSTSKVRYALVTGCLKPSRQACRA